MKDNHFNASLVSTHYAYQRKSFQQCKQLITRPVVKQKERPPNEGYLPEPKYAVGSSIGPSTHLSEN